jgi:hypothetical protein
VVADGVELKTCLIGRQYAKIFTLTIAGELVLEDFADKHGKASEYTRPHCGVLTMVHGASSIGNNWPFIDTCRLSFLATMRS